MTNPIQPMPYEIIAIKHETAMEYTFRIATDIRPMHGQFLQLSIPMIGEAPISVSEQGDGWLEFTIRKIGTLTNAIFEKQLGDILFLRGPYGNGWPVDLLKGRHLFVIAGGTGVSPVRSLLNACLTQRDLVKSVSLICGFKNEEGILFHEDLEKWRSAFRTWFCLDQQSLPGWHKGFVTEFVKELPLQAVGDNYAVLVVGPPPMMKFTGIELVKNHFSEDHIWMSFERKMSCAIGKCGHCRIDETYVCLDGPVFPYTKAKELVD